MSYVKKVAPYTTVRTIASEFHVSRVYRSSYFSYQYIYIYISFVGICSQ